MVCGAKLWNALHSDSWRHREAAAQAYLDYLESEKIKSKYLKDNQGKRTLFKATMMIAKVSCLDKLLQIYFIGLKTLSKALSPPICDNSIPTKMLNREVQPFVSILVEKIEELNYRAKDISLNSLINIFKAPKIELKMLIEKLMDITAKGPFPDKAPWRIILGRLDILLQVIKQLGYDPQRWDWAPVFEKLVAPSLFNAHPDVRLTAIEVICSLYQILGDPVRQATTRIENLRTNVFQLLMARMDEIDGGNYEGMRPLGGSRGSEGKFSLDGTSPTPALKAKADMIAAAQDLTVVEEQQEEFLGLTKSFISEEDKDESEIVVPMREPIKGQAASQTGTTVDGKLHGQGTEQY